MNSLVMWIFIAIIGGFFLWLLGYSFYLALFSKDDDKTSQTKHGNKAATKA